MKNAFELELLTRHFLEKNSQANLPATNPAPAQQEAPAFAPKFTHSVSPTDSGSMAIALSELNSAKSLMTAEQAQAKAVCDKLIQYISWFDQIGQGSNATGLGKNELIPTAEEMKSLIRTGLFGQEFITSIAYLLKLNNAVPNFVNEFNLLKNK